MHDQAHRVGNIHGGFLMISSVKKTVGDKAETFRMTTRAMMAIEDSSGLGIVDVMQGFEDGFRITDLALILSECGDDGAGIDMDRATAIVDHLGVTQAAELLGEIATAAFPEADKKGHPTKNVKRAPRSK